MTVFLLCPAALYAQDQSEDFLEIGGALRFNMYYTDYESSADPNDARFTFDTWRINVRGEKKGLGIDFEYRFYPSFNTHFIKQGWFYYHFGDHTEVQAGVTQVPFGNLQYNSHNWWFQGTYYVGLEDDHDMGIKLIYDRERWNLMLAYFGAPEPAGPSNGAAAFGTGGPGRYSYDIIPITGDNPWDYVLGDDEIPQSNQEINQLNLRMTYDLSSSESAETLAGISLQYGGIYNQVLDRTRSSKALAIHLDGTYGPLNIKAQYSWYDHDILNDNGESVPYTYMGGYGIPYPVAAAMNLYSLGISYSLDVELGPISNLKFYNDYTYFEKTERNFSDSQQNVLGVLVSAGDMYIYFDVASGYNQPWLTDDFGTGLASGVNDPRLNTRFNINIGYYF